MQFEARFFNGERLEPASVFFRVQGDMLEIRGEDGRVLSVHPAQDIILLFTDKAGHRVDLGVAGFKDLRLIVETVNVRNLLAGRLPQLAAPPRGEGWSAGFKISGGLIGILAIVGVAVWQLERIVPAFVPDDYAQIFGRSIANEYIEETGGQCSTPNGDAALLAIVARLTKGYDAGQSLTVRVADSQDVNAFAVPGGQIVIFRGLIDRADSADEVAGVLAHEIGHVRYKHPLRGLTRSVGISILASLFSGGNVSELTQQVIVSGFSRDMESDADTEAMALLAANNIDARPLAGFFERLAEGYSDDLLKALSFVSTHPASAERAAHIRAMQDKAPVSDSFTPILSESQWQSLQNICPQEESSSSET